MLAYQTAWLKAHHKAEFYAASMCYDMDLTDKLCIWVDDARRSGVGMRAPCVNASAAEFTVQEGEVRYGLGALKGVGEKAMDLLVDERTRGGPFHDLDQLAERIDPRLLNRRQLESLAAAGGLDALAPKGDGHWRARAFAAAETVLAHAASAHDARESGQGGLFGEGAAGAAPIRLPRDARWTLAETMAAEKEAFGFYFSQHPTDRYRHAAQAEGARSFTQVAAMPVSSEPERDEKGRPVARATAKLAALVEEARWRTSARGNRYMLATCSDSSGQFIVSCFDDVPSTEMEAAAKAGDCLLLTVELDRRPGEETPRLAVRATRPLEGMSARTRLKLEIEAADAALPAALAGLLADARGGRCRVELLADAGGAGRPTAARPRFPRGCRAGRVDRAPARGDGRAARAGRAAEAGAGRVTGRIE